MTDRNAAAPRVRVFPTEQALAEGTAARIAELARESVAARGIFTAALGGGSSPRRTYALLAAMRAPEMPWERTELFIGDDRWVAPDAPESNYRLLRETIIDAGAIRADQVHRMRTELATPEATADDYDALLRGWFDRAADGGAAGATLDLAFQGVGEDGHTASLFPGGPELEERTRWVVASEAPPTSPVRERVTLTLPALGRARRVLFLASGAAKREVVAAVLAAEEGTRRLPASLVHGREGTEWMLDAAAAE